MTHCLFVTHPEVIVDPELTIGSWRLSERGRSRAVAFTTLDILDGIDLLASSTERKALDAAEIIADSRALPRLELAGLGENGRESTGFLPPLEFEATADRFFAEPEVSVRGWERAVDAQSRIVAAVRRVAAAYSGASVVFVSHGAVGALLQASLRGVVISRELDQPRQGCWFGFNPELWTIDAGWRPLPEA